MSDSLDKILGGSSPKDVGKLIQKTRVLLKYSASELADRVGVSHVTILNVEKGEKLSRQILVALAKELNSSFNVTWLQSYLDKYGVKSDFYESFEKKIREIVRDEINKEKLGRPSFSLELMDENPKKKTA